MFPNVTLVLSERFGDGDASGLDLDEVHLDLGLSSCFFSSLIIASYITFYLLQDVIVEVVPFIIFVIFFALELYGDSLLSTSNM